MHCLLSFFLCCVVITIFSFASAAEKPHAVIVVGTHHYSPQKSMPQFAAELERLGFETTVVNPDWDPEKDKRGLPGLEALGKADVGLFFVRFLKLEEEQLSHITRFLESGKPVVCFRTSTHAFNYPESHLNHGLNLSFGREAFGTPYLIHLQGKTDVTPAKGSQAHPILTGIETKNWESPGTLYLTKLEPGATPLLMGTGSPSKVGVRTNQFGTHDLKAEMTDTIAWTWENQWGGRVFGTSLGHLGDFAVPESMRVMVNGVFWAAGQKVPDAKAEVRTFGAADSKKPALPKKANVEPETAPAEKVTLFYGASMVERLLEHGEMEARLQIAHPDEPLKIRSLAWTGDEVGNRLRLEGYVKHMKNLLARWSAETVVLGYGLNESFAGEEGLADFETHYRQHLKQLILTHPSARFVFLSPIAIEGGTEEQNENVQSYSDVIAKLAAENKADFVDLLSPTQDAYEESEVGLTTQGIHLNPVGNSVIAKIVAEALGGTSEPKPTHLNEVTLAAAAKHQRVAELVRPKNGVVYFGVRARPQEYADEMPRYYEMIRQAEKIVYELAKNPGTKFAERETPSLPPMEEKPSKGDGARTGIIKSVAEQQAEFTVADGYKVNLFASEEEFPELRNPVQIAFDARGRLWVVTMPSFPHTVPGLTPPDKILILEDTNHDGKADKVTTYMEGLDALDGVAFHRDGVIISEQPRLWMTRDSDGDDFVDAKEELLRGIDVTDSHHGGMIATDPLGQVIFSDGVFHRSQLETPFGVHRGIDATTYRLNTNTGRINTEWQHNTPNPWNVTFDRWGNIFQMYGDGGSHDGAALLWTPFGIGHRYNYAEIGKYGKGSGFAVISSPNFPDEYSEGIASASLLGRYAVNLTKFDYSHGLIEHEGPLTILSSPNAAFRPADVEFGMDGALYVSDFCSPIIGHAQHPMRSPHWDHDFGRIWRIVHTEKPLAKNRPAIEGAEPKDLCELLTHPQDLVRKHVRIELRKKGDEGINAVDEWIAGFDQDDENFDQAALEAIFVCGGLGQSRPKLVDALLASDDAMFRGAAVDVMRLLAGKIENVREKLTTMAADPHPRVQLKVIGAVAHLRQTDPSMESVLAEITSDEKSIQDSLTTMNLGTAPKRGRSVPVLEVDPDSEITHWMRYDANGGGNPVIHTSENPSGGDLHLFRTFIIAENAQSAILALNHKCLNVTVNDVLKFSQNSNWSSDQQIYIDLEAGRNVIEVELVKAKLGRGSGSLPAVYLYDSVGQALTGVETISDNGRLQSLATAHETMLKERGLVFRVQAAPGLQFSPKVLRVQPGAKVRVIFQNPDIMQHNFLLLAPGSAEEIGALADEMAAQPDGLKKHYIPDSNKVLVASALIAPQGEEELVFTAPTEPGEYPYICTFPGHWRVMRGVMTVVDPKAVQAKAPSRKKSGKTNRPQSALTNSNGVVIESADSLDTFKTLKPVATSGVKVTANQRTNNDPISGLTDGKLAKKFGPIFANGITDGAYKMDLGSGQSVRAVTSWSHNQAGRRGAQRVKVYGSNSAKDPGWKLEDTDKFTLLGNIETGAAEAAFTAASLREAGGEVLGSFRWIVWQVLPVTSQNENTAFQELSVETSPTSREQVKTAPLKRSSRTSAEPNVILVMTDDQGWGEVGFHGNKTIKTPNLDRFAAEGTELLNFYVSPMCTPTRSSLMTGRYHFRTGAHDTFIGRSNMNPQETTIAEVFAGAGYRTGIFGKWHLGENYPMRAQDQGFQKVVVHGGGGIGQFADYPGNTYWDSTLLYNDEFKKAEGYCTDVFIDESIQFIEENRDQPFFCYLPLNIPHSPFDVGEEFYQPYEEQGVKDEGKRQWTTKIYGMITQFDGAFQRLLDAVDEMGLKENTIVIFMTDNGPNSVYFTGGLRDKKGSVYENGFRSPFVIQWPGAVKGGRQFNDPTMHIDLLPTLAEAAGITLPADLEIDGESILSLLTGEADQVPERYLFMQHNRANIPDRYRNFMVRKGAFKVVQGVGSGFTPVPEDPAFEVYNIYQDPGETNNLAADHPDKVEDFVGEYETWFTEVTAEMRKNGGAPFPYELNPVQKQVYRFTWQCWFGPKANWRPTAYGRWTMNNPGLIERFDVTIFPQRHHHGKPGLVKFIWQGESIEKAYEKVPAKVVLKNIELSKGEGFMEANLQIDSERWGVKEVQIQAHVSDS